MANTNINKILHPFYESQIDLWQQYRLVGEGGEAFLDAYLERRTYEHNFPARKKLSYIPSIAKSDLIQICNSIRQRLVDVLRTGGSESYIAASAGNNLGVDRKGLSMSRFMGSDDVLFELVMLGRVGVYIDAPLFNGTPTLQDVRELGLSPYLYTYPAENIRAWAYDPNEPGKFLKLLLLDHVEVANNEFGLVQDYQERYRFYEKDPESGLVTVSFFDKDGKQVDRNGDPANAPEELSIGYIPFVLLELSHSLLADIARHQISLLNLASADVKYVWEGNIVFLAEQYDPNAPEAFMSNLRMADESQGGTDLSSATETSRLPERLFLGTTKGMRVAKGIEYPKYIAPDTGPLEASMLKQKRIEEQIHSIIHLNLTSIQGHTAGASETKRWEESREEDGLKVIGEELETAENMIAFFWELYEGVDPGAAQKKRAKITYPQTYEYRSYQDRYEEAGAISKIAAEIPSPQGRKEIAKVMVYDLLNNRVPSETLRQIQTEIDNSVGLITDPTQLYRLVEGGVVSPQTAAVLLGFADDEAEKAEEARVRRATLIALAQQQATGPAGVKDLATTSASDENKTNKDATRELKGKQARKTGSNRLPDAT